MVLAALLLTASLFLAAQHEGDWSEIVRGDPATGMVALTFDAGAEAGTAAPQVIQILRERRVQATFFLSGNWVSKYPDLAQQIRDDGHEIANHSLTHPDLTKLADNQIVFELDYTDQVVWDTLGVHTRPYFRPPFGARNPRVLQIAAASGFRSVFWTLDSGDWLARATSGAVTEKVLRFAQPGDIVVEHIASQATADALPTILDIFEERGWRVGTVSEVLGLPRYDPTQPMTAQPEGFPQLAEAERLLSASETDPRQAAPAAKAALRALLDAWSTPPAGDTVVALLDQAVQTDDSLNEFRPEAAVLDRFDPQPDAATRAKIFVDAARARLANI
jgi:peptidoglycan/xylan/chitin deacetylase (PgdA/CDA1 family)